jgi:hypothetical protein
MIKQKLFFFAFLFCVCVCAVFTGGIYTGIKLERFMRTDTCLDLGGKLSHNGHLCVTDEKTPKDAN